MAPFLPILALATELAPTLARWLIGPRAEEVTAAVARTVEAVAGTSDPDQASALIATNPEKAGELRLALARIAAESEQAEHNARLEQMKAILADVASARAATIEMAKAGHPMAWGAAVISVVVLAAFGIAVWTIMTKSLPQGSSEIVLYTLGSLQAMATAVVGYWVGSSAGSARKDDELRRLGR